MPKVQPKKTTTTRKRRAGEDAKRAIKDLVGTEVYEEIMEDDSDYEEDQSFQEGQVLMTDEEEEEDEEEQEDTQFESPVFVPWRSPRKKKQVIIPGTQEAIAIEETQRDSQAAQLDSQATQVDSQETQECPLPTITHKARTPVRRGLMSEDMEDTLIEWVETHPMLYNKADPCYKMTEKKIRLWNAKAKSLQEVGLQITGKDLQNWYDKMCALAKKKLEKLPSGSARDDISAEKLRKHDLKKQLAWLTPFLVTEAGETPRKMKKALPTRPSVHIPNQGPGVFMSPSSSQESPAVSTCSSHQGSFFTTPTTSDLPPPAQPTKARTGRRSRTTPTSGSTTSEAVESLSQKIQGYEDLLGQFMSKMETSVMPEDTRARKMLLDSLFMQVLQKLPDNLWTTFQVDFMDLVVRYRERQFEENS